MKLQGIGKGWHVGGVVRCLAALTLLIIPSCCGIEDGSGDESMSRIFETWAEVNMTYFDPQINEMVNVSERGKFGATGLVESESGVAVHVRHENNKTHGCDEYAVSIPKEKWIAVMERGHCYFTDKIRIATQNYNASAVVIYNHVDTPPFTVMQHSEHWQVAIFVSRAAGQRLAQLVDSGVRVMVSITPVPASSTRTTLPPNHHLAPLPATAVLCLSLLVAVVVMGAVVTTYCLLFSVKCRRSVSRCQSVVCPSAWSHWMPLKDASKATEASGERVHRDVC